MLLFLLLLLLSMLLLLQPLIWCQQGWQHQVQMTIFARNVADCAQVTVHRKVLHDMNSRLQTVRYKWWRSGCTTWWWWCCCRPNVLHYFLVNDTQIVLNCQVGANPSRGCGWPAFIMTTTTTPFRFLNFVLSPLDGATMVFFRGTISSIDNGEAWSDQKRDQQHDHDRYPNVNSRGGLRIIPGRLRKCAASAYFLRHHWFRVFLTCHYLISLFLDNHNKNGIWD